MKFGAFYGGRRPRGYDNPKTYIEQIEQVLYTDKMGFESAWFSEHHFTPNTISSPLIMSAYVAGLTKNIRVGPAVQLLPFHNPIRVAEETALIDVITNGRLNLGVGKGPRTKIEYWLNHEKTKYNDSSLDYTQSIEIFGEALDIMLAAWKHEKFSYKGKFNDINDIKIWPKPVQKPHPPIYVAAERPSGVKWIAKQGYNMILGGTWFEIEESKKNLDLFKDELKIHGHNYENIDVIYPVIAYVDDTNKIARNLVEKDLDYFVENFSTSGFRGPINRYRNSERDFDRLPLMGVSTVTQPSCFIAGSKDVVRSFVPGKDGYENVDELCDDMRLSRIIQGAGHWVQQESPAEVNAVLLEFLNTLP